MVMKILLWILWTNYKKNVLKKIEKKNLPVWFEISFEKQLLSKETEYFEALLASKMLSTFWLCDNVWPLLTLRKKEPTAATIKKN